MGMVIPGSVLAASMAQDSITSGKMDPRDPIRRKEELPGQGPEWARESDWPGRAWEQLAMIVGDLLLPHHSP